MPKRDRQPLRLGVIGAAGLVATYPLLLLGAFAWHQRLGPVHEASPALALGMGLGAALMGLAGVLMAWATLNATRRVTALAVVVALVVRLALGSPQTSNAGFLVWQWLVMMLVQVGLLIVALGGLSWLGWSLAFDSAPTDQGPTHDQPPLPPRRSRLSIRDLWLLTGALALLFAVGRSLRPSEPVSLRLYRLLVEGGASAALVALVVLAAVFSTAPAALRLAGACLIAPLGGLVYVWVQGHTPPGILLLFSAPFYAAVTTTQVAFMALPGLILRSRSLRFRRTAPGSLRSARGSGIAPS